MATLSNVVVLMFLAVLGSFVTEAQSGCMCNKMMMPVCGSNGVTYNNPCELRCAAKTITDLKEVRSGRCEDNQQEEELPIKTKPQERADDIDIPQRCFCTREYTPVCASNGRTYSNPCELNCAKKQNKNIQPVRKGPCEDENKIL